MSRSFWRPARSRWDVAGKVVDIAAWSIMSFTVISWLGYCLVYEWMVKL